MKFWGIAVLGLVGAAILISLGIWQVQRLAWKEAILRDMATEFASPPVILPRLSELSEQEDEYLPVTVTGRVTSTSVRVLVSQKIYGAGYRLIAAFDTGNERILLDRGFVSVNDPLPKDPIDLGTVTGNLLWPDERDNWTPANDLENNVWFARDLDELAQHLDTLPLLLVRRGGDLHDPNITPLPITTAAIPNDHLQYAVTWFSLALIWLGMTGYFLYRMAQR
ncbi:MAG: SURF1 family protein [Pseudomonadota bacterium]